MHQSPTLSPLLLAAPSVGHSGTSAAISISPIQRGVWVPKCVSRELCILLKQSININGENAYTHGWVGRLEFGLMIEA